jgi:hypothetical protein
MGVPFPNSATDKKLTVAQDAGANKELMPELSRFHGIIIRMFWEPNVPHHRPHFHAFHQDHSVSVAIDTIEVLEGALPRRQMRLVEAWAELHQAELLLAWQAMLNDDNPHRIEPL